MTEFGSVSRRRFLQTTTAVLAAQPLLALGDDDADAGTADDLSQRIYKTLKIGMVRIDGSLTDKFKAAKEAGFEAVELGAPGIKVEETRKIIAETGLPVDGTVCSSHWRIRHTSADPEQRATALKHLQDALRQTHAIGGSSVLLVVGHGQDGPEQEIWDRSIENISKAVPLAARLGVSIVIENVWNHFLYDHSDEPVEPTQTADKYVRYVDEFNSPWVSMQFDIGNHWKYGSMGDWIRTLGKRITKLDVKGFSRKENKFTNIGDGDVDWADVRKALVEINYYGWLAAEVGGGGPDRLREISDNMDRAFALKPSATA